MFQLNEVANVNLWSSLSIMVWWYKKLTCGSLGLTDGGELVDRQVNNCIRWKMEHSFSQLCWRMMHEPGLANGTVPRLQYFDQPDATN
jgi:hypothetical protein